MVYAYNLTASYIIDSFATLHNAYITLRPIQLSLGLDLNTKQDIAPVNQEWEHPNIQSEQPPQYLNICNESEANTCRVIIIDQKKACFLLTQVSELLEDNNLKNTHLEMESRIASSGDISIKTHNPHISDYYSTYHSLMEELHCLTNHLTGLCYEE